METATNKTNLTLSSSLNSNKSMKYGGLVHRSMYKQIKDVLVDLINYVFSVAPHFQVVHTIVSFFRIMQMIGPAIQPANRLWTGDPTLDITTSVISIFFHLLPPETRNNGCIYFNIVYIAISVIVAILIIGSAFYFNKFAKIPTGIAYFIAFYIATFNFLLHPIAIDFAFEMLGKIIFENFYNFSIIATVIVIILTVIVTLVYTWLYAVIIAQTLSFRPTSFPTLMPTVQIFFFAEILLSTCMTGFASKCTQITQIIFLVLGALVYLSICLLPFYRGGFIKRTMNVLVCSASINGAIICLIFVVFTLLDEYMSFTILIIIIALFVALYLVVYFIIARINVKHLIMLDHFMENNDMSVFKSVNTFINCVSDGMTIAHPACVNWSVFKAAMDQWPSNGDIMFVFARFCAIYPEDTQTLGMIFHTVVTTKMKGKSVRTIKEQTLSITRQREANLSPHLKTKLNAVQKRMQATKHKLRHVWDLAIQGNIAEMEAGIKNACKEIEKNDATFKHIFREFPNNRFVVRTYARFCKELTANHQEYTEYMEKARMLQKGFLVNTDLTHELGIVAYPSLPSNIRTMIDNNQTMSMDTSMSSIEEGGDEETTQDDGQINTLREQIDDLSIPAIRGTIMMRLGMLFIIFVIPMIALFIYSTNFIADLTSPLSYFEEISSLRQQIMVVGTFSFKYIYEELGVYNKVYEQDYKPSLFGGKWDTKEMLMYALSVSTRAVQEMTDFNGFSSSNDNVAAAQDLMFGNTLNFSYFTNPNNREDKNQTVQTGCVQIINEVSELLDMPEIDASVLNTSKTLNPANNIEQISSVMSDVLDLLILFITDNYQNTLKLTQILMIVTIILVVVLFAAALIVQLIWIQRNKEEAYKCLTALPKNVVSSLVENLRVLKNDDGNDSSTNNDTEMNKQEDNILKTFMTGGTTEIKIADRLMLIIGSIVTIVLEVVMLYLFFDLIPYESRRLLIAAPHLNYLTGAFTEMVAACYTLQMMSTRWAKDPVNVPVMPMFSDAEIDVRFRKKIENARNYYQSARFGGTTLDEAPFLGFQSGLEYAFTLIDCPDPVEIPNTFMEMIACYQVEGLYIICETILRRFYQKQMGDNVFVMLPNNVYFDYVWTLLISPIYEGLFGPMYETIIPTITEELQTKKDQDFITLAVLLVLGVVFEATVYIQIFIIEKHIKQTLKLLLHAPGSVLLTTSKITSVIGGDFSHLKGDNAKRNAEFYDTLYRNMPDAVMLVNSVTRQIETVNNSCMRLFFSTEEELVGQNLGDFLRSDKFSGDVESLLKQSNSMETPPIRIDEKDPDGGAISLEMKSLNINGKLAIIVHDVTNILRYNKLIRDERAKSDALLDSILPPSLVKRVQAGEKNISFAVQTASIIFMDIVSFTPWCGSNEATKVMMTLNLLFKKLDYALSMYPDATKIKCIGDCYMAAGGIFSEVNQPAEHAKQIVSFGLDALECVRELDKELDEKLQIRVGINTGGPIVAGVLGIGKPTFEILGPAINMAQQMEHHGVPMNVHISRPVYELIYGESFVMKERGNIEVKNGTVVTYLVTSRRT